MQPRNRRPLSTRLLTAAALLSVAALGAGPLVGSAAAHDGQGGPGHHQDRTYSFAVIGDVPYGDALFAQFPSFIGQINADPDVRMVTHLGDIKSGSTRCDTSYFEAIAEDFTHFADPLVYTPGDNEWTDCHRANNGGYNPLDRLAELRRIFFGHPNRTLGRQVAVRSQSRQGYPENVVYTRADVCFATLHVVGSNDSLAPWTGNTAATPDQVAEESGRMAANLANVGRVFDRAHDEHCRAVVLQQQADMFDATVTDPKLADYAAFTPLVRRLIAESNRFRGPVYLFNGDSHVFRQDQPLAAGSPWLSFYGVRHSADNLQRITVDGSDLGESDWLKVTAHSTGAEVLTFAKVPGA